VIATADPVRISNGGPLLQQLGTELTRVLAARQGGAFRPAVADPDAVAEAHRCVARGVRKRPVTRQATVSPDTRFATRGGWVRQHQPARTGRADRMSKRVYAMSSDTGAVTGTKDKDYNILWFTEACLSNVLRLETYIQDAERDGDSELADFFRRAQSDSRKGADEGKRMLASRLAS